MVALLTQRDFRAVQELPFCYLCGKDFQTGDITDRDHVPPKGLFAKGDREPALILRSHRSCNSAQGDVDNKMGQLLKLKRGEAASNLRDRVLKFALFLRQRMGAVTNVPIDEAVWRWIRGFHAALYQQPFPVQRFGSLVTPFPRGQQSNNSVQVEDIKAQHLKFVELIKANRAQGSLDRICSNNDKLVYECVWVQMTAEGTTPWSCVFALNLYDWKDLGTVAPLPARGCAGCYLMPTGEKVPNGTAEMRSQIEFSNDDPLDPFGG